MIRKVKVSTYLALSYALFILLVLGVASFYWIYNQEAIAESSLLEQLKQRARLFSTTLDLEGLEVSVADFPTLYSAINQNLRVLFISDRFQTRNLSDLALEEDQRSIVLDLGRRALNGEAVAWEDDEEIGGEEALYAAAPVYDDRGNIIGAVCLLLPLESFHESVYLARQNILKITAVLAFLGLGLGYMLASQLIKPLLDAQRLARRVAEGDYGQRLPVSGLKELSELTTDLNRMTDDLAGQDKLRRVVLSNVTHELARPLGGLRLAVESLRSGALEDEKTTQELLEDMDQTLEGMGFLLEDIALAARPGNKHILLHREKIDPLGFAKALVSSYSVRARLRGIAMSVKNSRVGSSLLADKKRLNQILGNLLSNALKFTPSGGHVWVSVVEEEQRIKFMVEDDGPGIPESDFPDIFDPFFQGRDPHQIRQGMGLGLSIVRQLVDAHGGSVTLENRAEGGLLATISLPIQVTD